MFRVGVNHHSGWSHDDHNINRRSGDSSRPRKFGTMLNKHPGVIPVRVFWWWTVSSCVKRWPNHNISPTADCPEIAGDFPSSATFWGPRSYEDVWFDQNHVLVWFISKLPPTNLHVEKVFFKMSWWVDKWSHRHDWKTTTTWMSRWKLGSMVNKWVLTPIYPIY